MTRVDSAVSAEKFKLIDKTCFLRLYIELPHITRALGLLLSALVVCFKALIYTANIDMSIISSVYTRIQVCTMMYDVRVVSAYKCARVNAA